MEQTEAKEKSCLGGRRNHIIFVALSVALQITMSIMYGAFVRSPPEYINVASALVATLMALLVVAGFGLYFSYARQLVWSSLGFNFLLTALSVQLYPLINALWSKARVFVSALSADSFSTPGYNIFLGNLAAFQGKENTITGGLRCALALVVAYSGIIGRVGPLECLLLGVLGTAGYELNRQIIVGLSQDYFGTYSIFTFGGYASLMMGILLTIREKRKLDAIDYAQKLAGCHQSALNSLFGALMIFLLLPILAYEGDNSNRFFLFTLTNGPLSVLLSMGSAIIVSVACGLLFKGTFRVKDVLNAVIAGGVISGTASYYITAPVLAIICGTAAAIFQYTLDNGAEKRLYQKLGHLTTYSFSLFGIQGLLGAIFAAGYSNRVSNSQDNGFVYSNNTNHVMQIGIYFISAAIGLATGLVIGFLCYLVSEHNAVEDMFHDRTDWQPDDGIRYFLPKPPKNQRQSSKVSVKDTKLPSNLTINDPSNSNVNVNPDPSGVLNSVIIIQQPPVEQQSSVMNSEQFDDFFFADMLLVPLD